MQVSDGAVFARKDVRVSHVSLEQLKYVWTMLSDIAGQVAHEMRPKFIVAADMLEGQGQHDDARRVRAALGVNGACAHG